MDVFIPIVMAVLKIVCFFALGAWLRHKNYIKAEHIPQWSNFGLDILLPPLIFASLVRDLPQNQGAAIWQMPAIGFGMILLGVLFGKIAVLRLDKESDVFKRTFHHLVAVANFGYLPFYILLNLGGKSIIPLLFLHNVGYNIGLWTFAVAVLQEKSFKETPWREILTPNLVATIAGALIVFFNVGDLVPNLLVDICQNLGAGAIPFMLLLTGASLSGKFNPNHKFAMIYLSSLRLIFIPLVFISIWIFLPISQEMKSVLVIISLMPLPAAAPMMVRKFAGEVDFTNQAALITTLLSFVTAPIGFWLYEIIIK